jgi:signal transduction histidine kinase
MRVLVVEDELKMARALRRGLEQEGYAVDAALDGCADELPADAAEVLASTAEEATRMSKIVDDLLTLAHRDEHHLELSLAPVDLASVATAVTTQLHPLADQGGVHLTVQAAHVPPVLADQTRLTQVVTNLVDNAVKYTGPDGTVEVRVWRAAGGAGLTVSDSGPGITAQDLPRVFDMNRVRLPGHTAPRQPTHPWSRPPQLAASVWVGDARAQVPMRTLFGGGPVYGGTFPALIFRHYTTAALAGP